MVAEHVTTENTDKLTYQLDQKTVEELKATETKAPEYICSTAGKCQWDDRSGGDADKDVQGEAISKSSWSNGKKMMTEREELKDRMDKTCV